MLPTPNTITFRPTLETAEFLSRAGEQENAKASRIINWSLRVAQAHLAEQTLLRNSFADQLVNAYRQGAILSAMVSKNGDGFAVSIRINGHESEFLSGHTVKAPKKHEWFVVLSAAKSAAFPDLVLDSFDEKDVPLGIAEKLENVGLLPLLEGPGGGQLPDALVDKRRDKQ